MAQSMYSSDSSVLLTYAVYDKWFPFSWTIKSLSWATDCKLYEESPDFLTVDGGRWRIRLYPFGINFLCAFLRMNDSAPQVLHYNVEFSTQIGDAPALYAVKAEAFTVGHMLKIPHDIVGPDALKNDTLAFQFRLKKCRREGPRAMFVVSEIEVQRSKREYSCSFNGAVMKKLSPDSEAKNILEDDLNFVMGEFFGSEEEAYEEIFPMRMHCYESGNAVVALIRSEYKQWRESRIHLLDVEGNIYASSEVGEHFYRNEFLDLFRYRKFLTVEQLEKDEKLLCREGQIDFILEIETSNGKISSSTSKTFYSEPCSENQNSLKEDMKKFFGNLKKPDLQFRIGKEVFQAHKGIVSAGSPVFRTMLKSDMVEKETGVVVIEGIEAETFKRLLRFIYTGTFDNDIDCEDIVKLYAAADRYSVVTLKRVYSRILKSYISMDNCSWLLIFSNLHQDDELRDAIERFIFINYDDIIHSEDWKFTQEKHPEITEKVLERYLQWNQKLKSL